MRPEVLFHLMLAHFKCQLGLGMAEGSLASPVSGDIVIELASIKKASKRRPSLCD